MGCGCLVPNFRVAEATFCSNPQTRGSPLPQGMFSAPWHRHARVVHPCINFKQKDHLGSTASGPQRRGRSRTPGRGRPSGPCSQSQPPLVGSASARDLASTYARQLWACLARSEQKRIQGGFSAVSTTSPGSDAWDALLRDVGAQACATLWDINWLANRPAQVPVSAVMWTYARARVRLGASMVAAQIHHALRVDAERIPGRLRPAGPSPSANLKLLSAYKQEGGDVGAVLDGVFVGRSAAAHSEGTHRTYDSHLNMVEWSCQVLGADTIPASIMTIQRVCSIVNDASTLRGWLAAWKLAHDVVGVTWAGDADPRLRLVRSGTARLAPPSRPRKRARLPQVLAMVRWSLQHNCRRWTLWAAMAALSYVFGFRVPSE